MKAKMVFGLFILVLSVAGCITEYNPVLPEYKRNVLFVDGNIIANSDVIFHISQSFPLHVVIPQGEHFVDNATVSIIGSNGYKSLPAKNQGKGTYMMSVGELDDDIEYGLQIEHDGEIYQSALSKPLHTPEIDNVSWEQPVKYGPVIFRVSTYDKTEGAKFFAWNYVEDWEISVVNKTRMFLDTMGYYVNRSLFYMTNSVPFQYCWKKNESNIFVFGSTESLSENRIINKQIYQCNDPSDDRFSDLYSFTAIQRTISKGAYEYRQNIKKLNEEMGGLFTPQPTEIVGNISCVTDPAKKIMGYVDVSKNITQKRIFIKPFQITRRWPPEICRLISNEEIYEIIRENKMTFGDLYEAGYRPAGEEYTLTNDDPPQMFPYEWSFARCTDCTAKGGTKAKPDFWPNDHE